MNKDKTIISLVSKLKLLLHVKMPEIVDYWESDLCAIGFKKGEKLVFVSTYNYFEEQKIKYDYDFEIIDVNDPEKFTIVQEIRDKFEEQFIIDFRTFLGV